MAGRYFGAQYTVCILASPVAHPAKAGFRTLLSELARGRPSWPAGYALAKWNFRSAIRFISQCQGKPCKEKLTGCTILPNVRASSTEGYMPYDICDHPLGNNIEFHPALRESQRFGFIWTRSCTGLSCALGVVKDNIKFTQAQNSSVVSAPSFQGFHWIAGAAFGAALPR